jgi:chaperone modulatory protein CbpM
MFATHEFLQRARLDAKTLRVWIEAGWVLPHRNGDSERFSKADLARARLIQDLKTSMGVNDEGVTVILDLVDQVHGLRRVLRELLSALYTQSETMRHQIAAELLEATSSHRSGDGCERMPLPVPFDRGRRG